MFFTYDLQPDGSSAWNLEFRLCRSDLSNLGEASVGFGQAMGRESDRMILLGEADRQERIRASRASAPDRVRGSVTREFGGFTWRPDYPYSGVARDDRPLQLAAAIIVAVIGLAAIGGATIAIGAAELVMWIAG